MLASHVTTSLVLTASAGVIVGVLFSALIALSLFELQARVQQRGRFALDVHGRLLQARSFQHRTLLALQEALASSLVAANRAVLHYDEALAAARRVMVRFDDVNQRLGLLIRDTGPLGRV